MNNGHSTRHFPLERRARQGDPLSAYLFILVLESLFIQLREHQEIQSMRIDTPLLKSLPMLMMVTSWF